MRLTLRTLLAYLDDTLEPAQAKSIGLKVAESETAQILIARIKQVTRRRRLTSPPSTGPGSRLDANSIAEYLDNELPSDQLAAVEETCLASDVHLAEVSACHQILTLVLGEPVLVPPLARQRMYGLVQGREANPFRKPPAAPSDSEPDVNLDVEDDADDVLLFQGFVRRFRSSLAWMAPLAAVLLLTASAFALRMALPAPTPSNYNEGALVEAPVILAEATPKAAPKGEELKPVVKPEGENKADAAKAGPDAGANADNRPAVPAGDKGADEVKDKGKADGNPPLDKATVDAKPKGEGAAAPPAQPVAQRLPAPSEQRRELGRYVSGPMATPSVLLQHRADNDHWQRVRPESRIYSTDRLVSLPGYKSEIRSDTGVHLQLWGDLPEFSDMRIRLRESAVTTYDNPACDLDFRLERGRVVISNHKPAGAARVLIRYATESWELELADSNAEVVLMSSGTFLPGSTSRKAPSGEGWVGSLGVFCLEGQATIKARNRSFAMPSPSAFVWTTLPPDEPAPPQPLPSVPDWWKGRNVLPTTPIANGAKVALEELGKLLSGRAAPDVILPECLKDPKLPMRLLALRCFAAIDDLPKVIDALGDERSWEMRMVASDILNYWIALAPENEPKLFTALRDRKYSPAHAEMIVYLLHQYSEEEIRNPVTYETLIGYLRSDKLGIRQLAYAHLVALAPDAERKIRYDPAGPQEQRERSVQLWKEFIPDGKLPPGR